MRAGYHKLHASLLEVHLGEFMNSDTSVSYQLPHATVCNVLTQTRMFKRKQNRLILVVVHAIFGGQVTDLYILLQALVK